MSKALYKAMSIIRDYDNLLSSVQEKVISSVPPNYLLMLALISEQSLTPTQIKQRQYARKGNISYGLSQLQKKGLIESKPSKHDGRSLVFQLTPEGRDLADVVIRAIDRLHNENGTSSRSEAPF